MQLSRCDNSGPLCMNIEKLQSFLLYRLVCCRAGLVKGSSWTSPIKKALFGTHKSEEERREMQYASLDDCFRMLTLCLISSQCIISIIHT